MKKIFGTFAILLAISVSPALAHCGSCGVGDDHSHAAKANVATGDLVDVAIAAGSFKTLVAAVQAAGLVDTLKSEGPFTVFAPTDDAFDKLPAGTVDALLADPEKLKAILLYHVVSGEVTADQVVKLSNATTVQGSDVEIRVAGGSVMVDDATVVEADVRASNGVIHVIDTVVIPAG